MAEFFNVDEPIVFENKTDSNFDIDMGIIFHKSGIYEVSILENRTVVSKVAERKTGKWINERWETEIGAFGVDERGDCWFFRECSNCHEEIIGKPTKYCPNCGAKMEGEKNG